MCIREIQGVVLFLIFVPLPACYRYQESPLSGHTAIWRITFVRYIFIDSSRHFGQRYIGVRTDSKVLTEDYFSLDRR